jgi:hypothetical protein
MTQLRITSAVQRLILAAPLLVAMFMMSWHCRK